MPPSVAANAFIHKSRYGQPGGTFTFVALRLSHFVSACKAAAGSAPGRGQSRATRPAAQVAVAVEAEAEALARPMRMFGMIFCAILVEPVRNRQKFVSEQVSEIV